MPFWCLTTDECIILQEKLLGNVLVPFRHFVHTRMSPNDTRRSKLTWMFPSLRLAPFKIWQYSISQNNCWFFLVSRVDFETYINSNCFVDSSIHLNSLWHCVRHLWHLVPHDHSLQGRLAIEKGYSTTPSASFSILSSTGTVVPGPAWKISWRQSRQLKHFWRE